jgi:hypothetical protein
VRLLLAEEDWLEKHKHHFQADSKEGGGGSSGGQPKGKQLARSDGGTSSIVKLTSEGTPRQKGRCHNCGIYGHWAQGLQTPKKEKKEAKQPEANVDVGSAEQPALMLATCDVDIVREPT